ncbi:5540_t:CDS:2, partial [Entrophospora sp. SA101]
VSLLNRDEISSSIKKKGGRRLDDIWEYVNKGESLGGEICEDVPENIKNLWRNYLAENTSSNTKNKRTINQPTITSHFHSNTPISSAKAHLLDQAILKAWICCGFAFHTIENPFIIDLFQIAAPGYNLPSREKLSGFLLESEAARIEQKVEFELDNLTLSLDGWTSPTHDSIYNYVVTTPKRKEYLIKLKIYNTVSQTSEFMANEISRVIEKIGLHKFAAVVTDSGSNLRVARRIINESYSHVLSFRCAAHAANLIASDFCGEIKSYTKTRWGSFCMTVDSIIRSKPVFDW